MKAVLSTEGVCPSSGLTIYGQLVPLHRVNLQLLENGIVMGYCPAHQTRWFHGDRGMCFNIKSTATVIERLFKTVKGAKNVKTQERGSAGVGESFGSGGSAT